MTTVKQEILSELRQNFNEAFLGQLLESAKFPVELQELQAKIRQTTDSRKLKALHKAALEIASKDKLSKFVKHHSDALAKLSKIYKPQQLVTSKGKVSRLPKVDAEEGIVSAVKDGVMANVNALGAARKAGEFIKAKMTGDSAGAKSAASKAKALAGDAIKRTVRVGAAVNGVPMEWKTKK